MCRTPKTNSFLKLFKNETYTRGSLINGHENQRDKNVPPIHNLEMDRRGFLTPPEGFSGEKNNARINY
ncbi:MAG: hypothetical protein HZA08_11470 [Nitrospirae bacterium]|nr:hypothetical protein [Nitrospirota bacterium]